MATHTTPKNEVCTYTYDLRDRQTLADWNSSTPDTAKTYWATGLLKSIDNGISKSDYAFNNRNLLTSETQTLSGQPARVVSHGYDADGLRGGVTYPSTQAIEYAWTARAQLQSVSSDGPPPVATYTYDKAGRNTTLVHENGITKSKTYDAASELLANTHLKGGSPVSGHGYTLDSTGRRTAETFADGNTPARSYGYDTANQVTAASYGSSLSDSYIYDPAGNRSTATIASQGGSSTTYTTNNANQYTTITGLASITYDANGNLTYENGVSYTWDSENRLLSVSDGVKRIDHTYDGQACRVTSKVLNLATSTLESETQFIYDGWNVVAEYQGGTSGSPDLTNTCTWGMDLSSSLQGAGGVGGLIMVEEINGSTTTAYHFHYDGNGNVTEITYLNGNNAASYRYDAFGNTLVATGTYAAENRYRFSTKPLDSEITAASLYYYGFRYYDPVTGRWPSRDPIAEKGGVNLYGFVKNDGVNWADVLGLQLPNVPNVPPNFPQLPPNVIPGPWPPMVEPYTPPGIWPTVGASVVELLEAAGSAVMLPVGLLLGTTQTAGGPGEEFPVTYPVPEPEPEPKDEDKKCKKCKACDPVVGTLGWRETHTTVDPTGKDTHFNKGLSGPEFSRGNIGVPHMHMSRVNQTPPDKGCVCRWNQLNDVIAGSNSSGYADANQPVAGGGIE